MQEMRHTNTFVSEKCKVVINQDSNVCRFLPNLLFFSLFLERKGHQRFVINNIFCIMR